MPSRKKQQLGGLFIAQIGAGFTLWGWYTALYKGYYYSKAVMLFPAILIIGLGLIIFPGYKEERIARGEEISGLNGLSLLTTRWRIILIISLTAGAVNFFLISSLR